LLSCKVIETRIAAPDARGRRLMVPDPWLIGME